MGISRKKNERGEARESQYGFTLMELLVVIAIIGILASVMIASLVGSRTSAHDASAFSTLRSAQVIAVVCGEDFSNLSNPPTSQATVQPMCSGRESWPFPLASGWEYGASARCIQDLDATDNSFRICAKNTANTRYIACTNTGCEMGNLP